MSEETALIPIEQVNAIEVFEGDALQPLLDKICEEARAHVPDLTTEEGRKEIASLAYKVARTKTTIDDAGKNHAAELKNKVKEIDARRKHGRDTLDALKAEVRKPLDDYEQAEADRKKKHTDAIERIRNIGNQSVELWQEAHPDRLQDYLNEVNSFDPSQLEEFEEHADETRLAAKAKCETAIAKRKQYDDDQAELERHRKEQEERERQEKEEREERERQEREEQIRKEAKEEERRKADEEAAEERRKLEEKAAEEKRRADQAEKEKQDAIEAEKRRKEEEAAEEERRKRNTQHKGRINREAAEALVKSAKIDIDTAKNVVASIAKGQIPNITIKY